MLWHSTEDFARISRNTEVGPKTTIRPVIHCVINRNLLSHSSARVFAFSVVVQLELCSLDVVVVFFMFLQSCRFQCQFHYCYTFSINKYYERVSFVSGSWNMFCVSSVFSHIFRCIAKLDRHCYISKRLVCIECFRHGSNSNCHVCPNKSTFFGFLVRKSEIWIRFRSATTRSGVR